MSDSQYLVLELSDAAQTGDIYKWNLINKLSYIPSPDKKIKLEMIASHTFDGELKGISSKLYLHNMTVNNLANISSQDVYLGVLSTFDVDTTVPQYKQYQNIGYIIDKLPQFIQLKVVDVADGSLPSSLIGGVVVFKLTEI